VPRKASPGEAWVSPKPRNGGLRIAVAYPNSLRVGMSNLGYQAILRAFLEEPGFDARRVFWNGRSLEFPDGGRSLSDFAVVAFSVSYQPDLVHLPRMLEAARGALVIGGGAALTINPETSAGFFDLIVLGDSEPVLPRLMETLLSVGAEKDRILEIMEGTQGAYFPSRYRGKGPVPRHTRAVFQNLDQFPARPAVICREAEFGGIYPLEVSRGCPAGCLFCAAGAVCGPVRFLGMDAFRSESELGLRYRKKIGLVGTAVSYHPKLTEMARFLLGE